MMIAEIIVISANVTSVKTYRGSRPCHGWLCKRICLLTNFVWKLL